VATLKQALHCRAHAENRVIRGRLNGRLVYNEVGWSHLMADEFYVSTCIVTLAMHADGAILFLRHLSSVPGRNAAELMSQTV
jgi:hypothetical protein